MKANLKIKKIALISLIGLVLLFFFLPFLLQGHVKKEIKKIVADESKGAYSLHWEKFKVNLFGGGVKLYNFELKPDFDKIESLEQSAGVDITGRMLSIKGFSYFHFFINKRFSIRKVELYDAHVDFVIIDTKDKKKEPATDSPDFRIHNIKSHNVSYRVLNQKENYTIVESQNFSIDVQNFTLNNFNQVSVDQGNLFFNNLQIGSNKGNFSLDSLHITIKGESVLIETGFINLIDLIEDLSGPKLKIFKDSVLDISMQNFKIFVKDYWDIFAIIDEFPNSHAEIDSIVLVKPRVVYRPENALKEGDQSLVNPLSNKEFLKFNIKGLLLQNGKFESMGNNDSRYRSSLVDSIFIKVNHFRPAPQSFDFPFIFDELEFKTGPVIYNSHDSLSSLTAKAAFLSSKYKTFELFGFEYRENLPEKEFFKKAGSQTDLPNIKAKEVRIDNFQYKRFLKNSELVAQRVLMRSPILTFTRDKNYPFKGSYKDLPNVQIVKIPIQFYVKEIEMDDGMVSYFEIPKGKQVKAMVWMNQTFLQMNNFTNINDSLLVNDSLKISGHTYLFGEGKMTVDILFKVLDKKNYQKVKGSIEPFNLEVLNSIAVPAADIELKGVINFLNFEFEVFNDQSKGWLDVSYDKLRVSIITLNKQGRKRRSLFKSMFFNLLVNNSYPKEGQTADRVKFTYKRDTKKWVINFWWKSLVEGIQETFDDDINEIKKIVEIIEDISNRLSDKGSNDAD